MMPNAAGSWLQEMLFPTLCHFCHRRCRAEETPIAGVCRQCLGRLPLRLADERLVTLRSAPDQPPAICPCHYEGMVRQALVRLKFGDSPEISMPFAHLISDALLRQGFSASNWHAVLAVPLHAARERERGYNQAGLIAAEVARRLLLPDWSDCLGRHKATGRQSELKTMGQRLNNVESAFFARTTQPLAGRSLLLIDDILSTGATMQSARQILIQAGATCVTLAAAAS